MKRSSKTSSLLWIILWFIIYVTFLVLDLFHDFPVLVTSLKYGGLVLCFLYVLIYSRRDIFLVLALGLTLVADGILIYNNVSVVGVLVFILVQATHFLRFSKIRAFSPLVVFIIAALIAVAGSLQNEVPVIFVLAIAYAVLIFSNIYEATKWFLADRSAVSCFAMIGFILFFLCDVCVGLSYLTTTATLPHTITILANYMAWAFYLPAQVLISFSGKRADFKKTPELIKQPELAKKA